MRRFRFLILIILLGILVVPALFIFLAIEKTPLVYRTETVNTETVSRARDLAKRSLRELHKIERSDVVSISATEDDLNSLVSIMARGIDRMNGQVNLTRLGLYAAFSYHLPHNPVGDFINIHFNIYPSESRLHLSRVTIGRINISERLTLLIVRVALDLILGNKNGTLAVNSVDSVIFDHNRVTLNIRSIPDIIERKEKIVQRLKIFRDAVPGIADPEKVRFYFIKLMELEDLIQGRQSVSLSYFIGPLFSYAQQQSITSDPAEENKAALLALAMFAGDSRFEKFVGTVHTAEMRTYQKRNQKILLGGREDLRLHFVISAGLKIITDSGITYAIGELKELLDAKRGGSGFSFADLAADLAGTRLAETATDPSGRAKRVQSALAGNVREDIFFPNVFDLPEDLSQKEFEHDFDNVENPKYLHLVEIIKNRISRLSAYK